MQECRKQNVEEYHSCGYRSFSILYSAFCILHYSWFAALMISTKSAGFRRRKVRCMRNALAGISFCAPLLLLSERDPLRWVPARFPCAPPIRPPSSSSQSPLCSGQPAGYPSLRSLAPPLRHGPASLGSVSVSDFPARRGRLQFIPGSRR